MSAPDPAITLGAQKIAFGVRLTPRGGRDALDGWWQDAAGTRYVRARVKAAPHDGAANAALTALLAKTLGVPKSHVFIVAGASARLKRIAVTGHAETLASRLRAAVEQGESR